MNPNQRVKIKMAEKDIGLEKFSGTNAREWTRWLEDYRIFGGLKKWNEEKLISNLRFFVSGDVKDCVRLKCGDEPKELQDLEKEVSKFLGGTLDSISAVHELDNIVYAGSVERTVLRISDLITFAYPTITAKRDRQQMVLLHLQKLVPQTYQKELIKGNVQNLEQAVQLLTGLERADRSVRQGASVAVNRVEEQPKANRQCFVCGLNDHVKAGCPFKGDICGRCEKRGHLSTMCRGQKRGERGNEGRPAFRGGRQARSNPHPLEPSQTLPAVSSHQLLHPTAHQYSSWQHLPQQQQWSQPPPVARQQHQN